MKYAVSLLLLIGLGVVALAAPASAHTRSIDHGGTYFGNVVVEKNQVVDGDVTVFGDATIEGTINGDLTVFGNVDKRPGSEVTGDTTEYNGDNWAAWMPWGSGASAIAHENHRLMFRLAFSVLVVLIFLIFPVRVRIALDRVEQHPGLSAAVGVLALVAVVPIAVLLFISLIGWPLIPIELLAVFAGVLIGQAALGLLVGRRLYELVRPHGTPTPLAALILGLVVISAAEILPIVGGLVTALVWLVGLGATVLAFIRETTFMGTAASGNRPTIGGPPMTV